MTDTISKERVIENAQNIYDMFVSNYGFSSVLALDMKTVLDTLRSALAQQAEQDPETAMIDAAMVEMKNIVPPLRRSECRKLIRAALAATHKGA